MVSLQKSLSGEDMMTEPNQEMLDNMQEMMAQKAGELFRLCDKEEKGFITKTDMQRLRAELPVSPDQLEVVFDSLDNDGNGYLTLEEFADGFGSFLGIRSPGTSRDHYEDEDDDGDNTVYEGEAGTCDPQLEEKQFVEMLHHTGASRVFQDEDIIKAMWQKLHREEPDMASTFEDFIAKLASDIKKSKVDFQSLESALMSKNNEHEKEVKKLYEEMELQIKQERERILAEEKAKERQIRTELEQQLYEKEKQLQEILNRHQEMEQKLSQINNTEAKTKLENEKLQKEKEELEEMLSRSQDNLEESRTYIQQMQLQQKDEKRERARAALMLSEGIAIERESLVKQLDLLKDVNKRLRDDKDEAEATDPRRDGGISIEAEVEQIESTKLPPTKSEPRKKFRKQGSIIGKYLPGGSKGSTELVSVDLDMEELQEVCGDDDVCDVDADDLSEANVFIPGLTDGDDDDLDSGHHSLHRQHHLSGEDGFEEQQGGEFGRKKHKGKIRVHSLKRSQPVGADSLNSETTGIKPERIFKVVFIGDSGVGKSTYIHRFCHHEFKSNFQATIGVDFQVKTMDMKDTTVILQLWDTAGQERYRSLTKTYFRKSDGVIVMYDVTVESTFTSVRNWMTSVQEQVEPGTVIMLLGNKLDMAEDDANRPVKEKDGRLLATDSDMLFYETSAKSGANIKEAMEEFTRTLQEKEDKKLEEGLKLTDNPKKKKCCSR